MYSYTRTYISVQVYNCQHVFEHMTECNKNSPSVKKRQRRVCARADMPKQIIDQTFCQQHSYLKCLNSNGVSV